MLYASLSKSFETLAGCQDGLFEQLWEDQRLKFGRDVQQPHDTVDKFCARLVCATITKHDRLLLVLPDFKPHRPALLFTTALLRCWYAPSEQPTSSQPKLLYFGTTVGIREHLSLVRIQGFRESLSEVFQQQNVGRRGTGNPATRNQSEGAANNLPRVVTFYSPADAASIIRQHNPECIAVDLDESAKADWLASLLEEATRSHIPVVAWGVNPLADCLTVFKRHGQTIVWPSSPMNSVAAATASQAETQLNTLVLEGDGIEGISSTFREIIHLSVKAAQLAKGRLGQDAVRQHLWYTRALESLFVPYNFYEAEAARFWGLKTFAQLRAGCEHFHQACERHEGVLNRELERIFTFCNQIEETLHNSDPPLWNALCNLCIDEPNDDEARLFVFSGISKKQLFLLSLLAYHNLTESDLREIRIWIVTLDELRRLVRSRYSAEDAGGGDYLQISSDLNWRPMLIGLPGASLSPKLLPVLQQANVDVVVYPHQVGTLKRRANEWKQALSLDLKALDDVLKHLNGEKAAQTISPEISLVRPRMRLSEPVGLEAGTARRRVSPQVTFLWKIDDPVAAVTSLLEHDDNQLDENSVFYEPHRVIQLGEDETWCDEAVKLCFESGVSVTYPNDEFINVVIAGASGPEVDERSVRSLRDGDRIVLIHGQQRQSFYELIISRMHQHPSLILHLSLIRRWQTDFVSAYYRWYQRGSYNAEQLLKLMNEHGSGLTSSVTIQAWLRGQTLCPQDTEDLRRLSEILEMDFVRKNYQRIGKAASRLRGLHRGVANKLNRWLQQQATGIDAGNDDEIIDPDLGLTFGDLKSSLSLQRISAVQVINGPLLRSCLGRLEA